MLAGVPLASRLSLGAVWGLEFSSQGIIKDEDMSEFLKRDKKQRNLRRSRKERWAEVLLVLEGTKEAMAAANSLVLWGAGWGVSLETRGKVRG